MSRLAYLWAHHRIALLLFCAALGLSGLFLTRAGLQMVYWNDPAKQDQTIQGWMTPRYVSMSYRLPMDKMQSALDLSPGEAARESLAKIAAQRDMPLPDLIAKIEDAITRHRALQGTWTPPPTADGPRPAPTNPLPKP